MCLDVLLLEVPECVSRLLALGEARLGVRQEALGDDEGADRLHCWDFVTVSRLEQVSGKRSPPPCLLAHESWRECRMKSGDDDRIECGKNKKAGE